MTNEEIGKIFKVSKSTIARLLTSLKIPSKHPKLTKERKNRICECYLNGMSFLKISKLLHCSQAIAKLVILESGIELKDTRKYNQKYSINEMYFNNIDVMVISTV